ncbi:MAG: B12-binding domain-containing radical SAM protein [Desulfobacterales bacterium]|nr:B12-binding domain-containing radical SAM protein [Desulfobacterales bacterium]
MPDVLLIQPPIQDFYITTKRTIPYGLTCIAACLIAKGFSVEIFDALATNKSRVIDMPLEMAYLSEYYNESDISPFALFHYYKHFGYSFEYIAHVARESSAFLIGISSLFTAYSDIALKTAEIIKDTYPRAKIVLGGHHPTHFPEHVMESKAIDFVLRGEGEVSMPLLASRLKGKKDISDVPGIVYRQPNGKLIINEPAYIENLDDMPLPAFHLINHSYYQRNHRNSAVVVASRGCPLSCSYCAMGSQTNPFRKKSISYIIREIHQYIHEQNVRFIDFEDENLTIDRKWFQTLMCSLRDHFSGINVEYRAMNGLFLPSLEDDMIIQMKLLGFQSFNISLCSTSIEQLHRFQRQNVTEYFNHIMEKFKEYGLDAVAYIIVGGPYQKAEESIQDLMFLAKHRVLAGVSVYYPAPGSKDFEMLTTMGLLPKYFSLMRSTALPISHITTQKQSITLLRLSRIVNFIKQLIDRGIPLTCSEPLLNTSQMEINKYSKEALGLMLAKPFFNDGIIRGIRDDGYIYQHTIDHQLTKKFINEFHYSYIKGVKSTI